MNSDLDELFEKLNRFLTFAADSASVPLKGNTWTARGWTP